MSNLKKNYKILQENFEEVCAEYCTLLNEICAERIELKYLHDFVEYKNLEEDFKYFKENAYLDNGCDLPFPNYILKK